MCIAPAPRVTVRFSHADPFNTNHLVSTFQGRLTPFLLIRPNTTPRSPRNFGLGRAGETGQGTARPFPIKLVLDFAPIGCSEPGGLSPHPAQASHEELAGGQKRLPCLPFAVVDRRRQWVCMRRSCSSSGSTRLPARALCCLRLALRVVGIPCSHSLGERGWWSACRRKSPQLGHRPPCL